MNTIRVRCRVFAIAAASLAALLAPCGPASPAQTAPPGMPADIAAILQKAKSGQPLTQSDIQKLQAYGQGIGTAHGDTSTPATAKNGVGTSVMIPCNIECTEMWKRTYQSGSGDDTKVTETGSIKVTSQAQLVVAIHGTGDYYKNVLNPNVGISMFRFQAMTDANGQPIATGNGQFTFHSDSSKNQVSATGFYTPGAACGFVLTTTGKGDALYAAGQIGGKIIGKKEVSIGRDSQSEDNVDLTDLAIDVPFPHAPGAPKPKPGQATPASPMAFSYSKIVSALQSRHSDHDPWAADFRIQSGHDQTPG